MRVILLQENSLNRMENGMEPLIISMFIFAIIFIIFLPLDKVMNKNNLHKLIIFLNQKEYKPSTNKGSFKNRICIFSEKMYKL